LSGYTLEPLDAFPYIIEQQENQLCGLNNDSLGMFRDLDLLANKKEQLRLATLLSISVQTSHLSSRLGVSVEEFHNDRYNGLYRKSARELRVMADLPASILRTILDCKRSNKGFSLVL
jgi:hypothetical protein